MATSSFKPETTHTAIGERDPIEIIIALLVEYSAKLTDKLEQQKRIKYRQYLLVCIYFLNGTTGSLVFDLLSRSGFPSIYYMFALLLTMLLLIVVLLMFYVQRGRSVKKEVDSLASQLRRVVERASALEDHGGLSFGKRFELDIRLNDAENALDKATR